MNKNKRKPIYSIKQTYTQKQPSNILDKRMYMKLSAIEQSRCVCGSTMDEAIKNGKTENIKIIFFMIFLISMFLFLYILIK